MKKEIKDLSGTKFGRWTIIERVENCKSGHVMWKCICDCGTESIVYGHLLKEGAGRKSMSCGCLRVELAKERFKTHGHESNGKVSSEYTSWSSMLQRCGNVKHRHYAIYGGNGITVCERWKDFKNFIADMGNKPTSNHSIDRIDPLKGYEPSNCRWADKYEQAQNRLATKRNTNGGYVGVTLNPVTGRYYSRIRVNNKVIRLGTFDTIEQAFEARLKGEELYFGRVINVWPTRKE